MTTSFSTSLSDVLGEQIELSALVALPESDTLVEGFQNGYQTAVHGTLSSYRKFFRASESRRIFQLTDCLTDRMFGERVQLLAKLGMNCGAATLNSSVLLKHTASIIPFDGDSLSSMSMDRTEGLLIDHNPDDSEQAYEAAFWGDSIVAPGASMRPEGTGLMRPEFARRQFPST